MLLQTIKQVQVQRQEKPADITQAAVLASLARLKASLIEYRQGLEIVHYKHQYRHTTIINKKG